MAECPICLGNVEDACVAPCNHSFCRQCIVQVLVRHPPEWAGSCPLCRTHISVYNLRSGGEVLVQPEVLSLWGTVFVQHGKLGLASYHFESPEECYISYAAAPPSWRLDDGSPPPERKPWKEVSYDEETRIFRGVIEWDPAFFQDVRWVYRLEFAEDFAGIVGGEIVSSSIDGQSQTQPYLAPWVFDWERHLSYLRYTPPPETIFGSVYVQGRLYAPMLEGVASYHFEGPENCYISYSNAPEEWRLDTGAAPPARKLFEKTCYDAPTRTFRGSVSWPEGFDGAVRWEYTMTFAEDLSSICGGKVQPYGPLGFPRPPHRFGDPAGPDVGVLYYTRRPPVLDAGERLRAMFLAEAVRSEDSNANTAPSAEREPEPARSHAACHTQ